MLSLHKTVNMNVNDKTVIIEVAKGKLKGYKTVTLLGRDYLSFQGIPYAKPPLGELRFKAPEPVEKWNGIRDATKEGSECYAKSIFTNAMVGSEDCLYLNVYSPYVKDNVRTKRLFPVMFWIHGGGFVRGSGGSDLYGPDYFVEKDIVLVTINYRLGPLGFLALSDPSLGVTGNVALKDMVMALKWVQINIKKFRGDPKNITIFGESSGSVAVHSLILSSKTKGLFHKAIMQSGCALNCFSRGRLASTYELAHKLGIQCNNDTVILSELQKVPVKELVKAGHKVWDSFLISHVRPFSLVIEPENSINPLITEEPLEIINSGRYNKVPMIIGYNSKDGVFISKYMQLYPQYFLTDGTLVPHTMNLRMGSPGYDKVALEIKKMYGVQGGESLNVDEHMEIANQIYTHNYFAVDTWRAALLHSKNSHQPVYFYKFDLDTTLNIMKDFYGIKTKGATHADDLFYFFTTQLMPRPDSDSIENGLIEKVTTLWSNFAKNGYPHRPGGCENWTAVKPNKFNYLLLKNDSFKCLVDPDKKYMEFWHKLYKENERHISKL
ncbi:hypothetical protein ABEB36_007243 [Hypothenemus hampei]|uniref:Carboxylic ester hydrolase n=1 Tax=Hypothenemus hampei TaxID=57062 RepID=A0ABD1ETF9_HYPHA